MVEQYETELAICKTRYDINVFTQEAYTTTTLENDALKIYPSLYGLLSYDASLSVSHESTFTSIADNIIMFIKKVVKTIYKFIHSIFSTQAGGVDKRMKYIKRKIKYYFNNIDTWAGSSIVTPKKGMLELTNNLMLFKILSADNFDYIEWLNQSNHLQESSDFLGTYSNVVNFINDV